MDTRTLIAGVLLGIGWISQCFAGATVTGPHDHILVKVPAGEYALGHPDHKLNKPHQLTTPGFFISDAETTNAQFAAFVKATGYQTIAERNGWSLIGGEGSAEWQWVREDGANWRQPFGPNGPKAEDLPDHPVTQISGEDARAYCKWAGGRLPHIDEWETASRAGARTTYPWGDTYESKSANIWDGTSHAKNTMADGFLLTAPVRSFAPNAWGLYDVIGNVFEYCEGHPPWMGGPDTRRKICGRGGSWWCGGGWCGFHNLLDVGSMIQSASLPNQGFRVVFDLSAIEKGRPENQPPLK